MAGEGGGTGFNGKISIEAIYQALASFISGYETDLRSSISNMSSGKASDIDQKTLLEIQAKVQTWGVIVSTSTGLLRAVGDVLRTITQNIR